MLSLKRPDMSIIFFHVAVHTTHTTHTYVKGTRRKRECLVTNAVFYFTRSPPLFGLVQPIASGVHTFNLFLTNENRKPNLFAANTNTGVSCKGIPNDVKRRTQNILNNYI